MSAGPPSDVSDVRQTFELPHYARLWTSNLIQFTCFQVVSLAMQWLVTTLTPSRTALGVVGFVQGGTMAVASPGAGIIVDRYSKRNLLAIGRVGITAIALGVGTLAFTGSIQLWHILVAVVIGGLLASVIGPATQTFVVDVVGKERVHSAIALNAMGSSVGHTGGAALAGVLIAGIGLVATYFSAALALCAATALILTIPIRGSSARTGETSALGDLRQGLAFVLAHPPILLAMIACSMALFNGAIQPMRPIFARHVLQVGSEGFGTMAAAHGVGTIVAAVGITLRPPRRNLGIIITVSMLAFASGLLLYSFAFSFSYVLVIEFWLGFTGQIWNVAAVTGFQVAVPEGMRGRVLSLVFMNAHLGFVGIFFVGVLADLIGDRLALGIFGAIPTAVLVALLMFGYGTLKKM